jgi:competence protein ComEA
LLAVFLLILIIVVSTSILLFRHDTGQELVIKPAPQPTFYGQIYVSGAVANPGSFSLVPGDSIQGLVDASGGVLPNADLQSLQLNIPSSVTVTEAQKVDINRAELWLLQALPGIGEVKAQAILDYRQQKGYFHNIEELKLVPGISDSVFTRIREYITTGN